MNFHHLLFIVFMAEGIFGLPFSPSGDGGHHGSVTMEITDEVYHGAKDRKRINVSYNGKVWLCEAVTDGTGNLHRLADCIYKDDRTDMFPSQDKNVVGWVALLTFICVSVILVVVLAMFAFEIYDRCLPCNCFADGAGRGGWFGNR